MIDNINKQTLLFLNSKYNIDSLDEFKYGQTIIFTAHRFISNFTIEFDEFDADIFLLKNISFIFGKNKKHFLYVPYQLCIEQKEVPGAESMVEIYFDKDTIENRIYFIEHRNINK
jgi:hypothetical protein